MRAAASQRPAGSLLLLPLLVLFQTETLRKDTRAREPRTSLVWICSVLAAQLQAPRTGT